MGESWVTLYLVIPLEGSGRHNFNCMDILMYMIEWYRSCCHLCTVCGCISPSLSRLGNDQPLNCRVRLG